MELARHPLQRRVEAVVPPSLKPKPMITPSRQQLLERLDLLTPPLKDVLFDPAVGELLESIGKRYGWEQKKTDSLFRVLTNLLFGFLPPGDFVKEVQSSVGLDASTTESVVEELNLKILGKVDRELKNFHQTVLKTPGGGGSLPPRKTISIDTLGGAGGERTVRVERVEEKPKSPTTPKSASDTSSAPFILHSEKSAVESNQPARRGFSLSSLRLFGSGPRLSAEKEPVRVQVETPDKEKDAKRVVHYNELHTPLTPFTKEGVTNFSPLGGFVTEQPRPATPPVSASPASMSTTASVPKTAPLAPFSVKPPESRLVPPPPKPPTFPAPSPARPSSPMIPPSSPSALRPVDNGPAPSPIRPAPPAFPASSQGSAPATPPKVPPTPFSPTEFGRPTPKLEGNTVDLSKRERNTP